MKTALLSLCLVILLAGEHSFAESKEDKQVAVGETDGGAFSSSSATGSTFSVARSFVVSTPDGNTASATATNDKGTISTELGSGDSQGSAPKDEETTASNEETAVEEETEASDQETGLKGAEDNGASAISSSMLLVATSIGATALLLSIVDL